MPVLHKANAVGRRLVVADERSRRHASRLAAADRSAYLGSEVGSAIGTGVKERRVLQLAQLPNEGAGNLDPFGNILAHRLAPWGRVGRADTAPLLRGGEA